jgi:hypothetical protein
VGAEVQLHSFLTSALDGQQSTSRASRFTPVKCAGTHRVCQSAGLAFREEKNRLPLTGFKPRTGLLLFVVFFVEFTVHLRDDLDSVKSACQNLTASPDNISHHSIQFYLPGQYNL